MLLIYSKEFAVYKGVGQSRRNDGTFVMIFPQLVTPGRLRERTENHSERKYIPTFSILRIAII